ncbi:peptidoglycan recognition family protein [Dokdonella sp.]|uniref:N-acetylmuramoyl-L-alanine amidase n=1 Tax=Dokdonella sp. TaxID=2291710 RepID=UPI001AFE2BCA|nr:peptidoglycan recognition family protein [Dokdonella sp.]MBO9661522.1 N-acetylmuramoyl-L-alanine amidase [Dokdonella sp.]
MRINRLVLGFALLSCTTVPAFAQSRDATSAEWQAADGAALTAARAGWPALFDAAYARYPQLPRGVLESIAYVQSRWVMLDGVRAPDAESAPAVGLMGLYQGDGFADQVGDAAALLGVSRAQVEREPRWNILGAAALLAEAARRLPPDASEADLLAAYAGFDARSRGAIDAFARESFAYDVLLTLDRGVDDGGIRVEARAIEWERQFAPAALVRQHAPFVRLDLSKGSVEADGYTIDAREETLHASGRLGGGTGVDSGNGLNSTDYAPALWVASPYFHARSGSTTAVAIHTMQGSYAGSISWFQSNPSSVSAHYLIRSSDGQVTQMVREAQAAHHIGSENSYTLGIEHEGYVDNAAWYTTAMYNASAALTRHFCARYAIPCSSAYNGAAGSGINVLPASVKIKGHQHYPGQTHTDPGINWDWRRYYTLLNPGSGGTARTLDGFESNEGHFDSTPAYSGSTTGIAASSTAERDCTVARVGSCSEHLRLVDNPSDTQPWAVRFLSGSGTPSANTSVARDGKLGFWVYVAGSGFSVGLGVDDSDGTERSTLRAVPADTWTWVEWNLADAAVWNAWVGGNGAITAANVTLDAIWLERAHTAYTVNVYLDEVRWTPN